MVFRDVDEIADDVYRRSASRLSELRAANQRTAAEIQALTEQTAAKLRQAVERAQQEEHTAERSDEEQATAFEVEGRVPDPVNEVQRLRDEELRRQQASIAPAVGGAAPHSGVAGSPSHPAHPGDLDPREAIARAAAARRRNSVVAPIDDDGDNEAEYYRRDSWLV